MHNTHKYAKAIFNIANNAKKITEIQKEFQFIANLYKKNSAFRLLFITKKINSNQKTEIINTVLSILSPLTLEFLKIIINNNQSNELLNVIKKFNHLSESHLGFNKVDIITATKLSEQELHDLSQTISGILNNSPLINNMTDPDIIGGMKLRVGNNIFDNSVNYQINQLKKTLHNM